MMDKLLVYLLKRKIHKLINELNHSVYTSVIHGKNRTKEVNELDDQIQLEIYKKICTLDDVINIIKK